jgi:hypothetical protein
MPTATKSAQDGMAQTTARHAQPEEVALNSLVECAATRGAVTAERRARAESHHAEVTA